MLHSFNLFGKVETDMFKVIPERETWVACCFKDFCLILLLHFQSLAFSDIKKLAVFSFHPSNIQLKRKNTKNKRSQACGMNVEDN